MDELERLRRTLEEPPATVEDREAARQVLHDRYSVFIPGRRKRSIGLASVSAIAIASVVLLAVLLGPEQAEAWGPVPVEPPDPAVIQSASDECDGLPTGNDRPLVVDQRGDVAVALFGHSTESPLRAFGTCTLALVDGQWHRVDVDDLSFELVVMAGSVDERVLGAQVERVVIDSQGQDIDLSHQDGFYLIWWPQSLALTGKPVRFLDSEGNTLLEVPVRPNQPPGG